MLLLLLPLLHLTLQTCPLKKAAVENGLNAYFDTTAKDAFDTNELAIKDSPGFNLICKDTKHVFINAVRAVDDVDIAEVDAKGYITGSCKVNNMIPNIFVSSVVDNDYNSGTRKLYCARGCNPLYGTGLDITYPSSMLGNEANSPPILISKLSVTIKCATKYAQKVGNSGKTEVQCLTGGTNGWTNTLDQLIQCANGCPDKRTISNGFTRANITGSDGEAPFDIGDILPFECNPGYTLVGYSTLTCTSDYQWHENTPECVPSPSAATRTTLNIWQILILLFSVLVLDR